MALSDHLRELRARLLKSAVVIVLGVVVSLFFFDQIFHLVLTPYNAGPGGPGQGRSQIDAARSGASAVR